MEQQEYWLHRERKSLQDDNIHSDQRKHRYSMIFFIKLIVYKFLF